MSTTTPPAPVPHPRTALWRGSAIASALVLTLSACGSDGDDSTTDSTAEDVQAALEEGGELTVWAWEPTLEQVAEDFEAEYPDVTVDVVNVGTGDEHYTALQNALSAGSGLPDAAQVEYFALGQFTVAEHLLDLGPLGAQDLEDNYSTGPWEAIQGEEGEVHGLPMDSGPVALFYNKDVFDEHGIDVPTTWDEYVDAARDLQEADSDVYITSDDGDPGTTTSHIWQAGGQPYSVDGDSVTIDFTDEGSQLYTETWQQLIDEDLLSPTTGWTDEWYQGLGDGTIATLVTGAWMPANLESGVAEASGSWRVAPPPQWEEGDEASSENGGSALGVPVGAENSELGYAFIEYANAGDGIDARLDQGAFPATVEHLESQEFLDTEFEYFDGQQANEIFAESAQNVREGWEYLPFQAHANSIFSDTAGQAYISSTTLAEGLADWQEASASYGEEQGFSMSTGE